MTEAIVQFLDKLVTEFSWRRVLLIVTVLALAVATVVLYESYTRHFRMARVERTAALLEKLAELSVKVKSSSDATLMEVYKRLVGEVDQLTGSTNPPLIISALVLKTGTAALPWLLLTVIVLSTSGRSQAVLYFIGMITLATPFVVLASFLPLYRSTWINYLLYPWGHFTVVCVLVVLWDKRKKRRLQRQAQLDL